MWALVKCLPGAKLEGKMRSASSVQEAPDSHKDAVEIK